MTETLREQAVVLALAAHTHGPWQQISQAVEAEGSAVGLLGRLTVEGRMIEDDGVQIEPIRGLNVEAVTASEIDRFEALIVQTRDEGYDLVTVLGESYPRNLRLVHDRPPFLFSCGESRADDERSIAVVGTRTASQRGLDLARSLAQELVRRDVTVVSGLARGIDGAAHTAALDAGGRTVAVVGSGIRRTYPAEHRALAERICAEGGAILSQFLPDAQPRREHFPLRNRTMSGYAVGTVVVEASSTSGAKMQARLALAHNKRVFLVRDLVTQEPWAQKCAEHPAARVVNSVDDIVEVLDAELDPAPQLTLV